MGNITPSDERMIQMGFLGFGNYSKPGRGVSKDEPKKTGIPLYFEIFIKRFWKFITLNIVYILSSIISVAAVWLFSRYAVALLLSILKIDVASLSGDESAMIYILAVCIAFALVGLFGTGAPTAASAYVMRNYVNDSHSWVISDYFEHLKKNFIQGTIVFVVDLIVFFIVLIGLIFYTFNMPGILGLFLRTVLCVAFVIYAMMHMYIYQIMAKFTLKLKDIYRNSMILVLIKLPWNVLSFAASILITYVVLYLFVGNAFLGIVLAGLIYFSLNIYTQIFMTNNIVSKYMLEPSLEKEKKEKSSFEEEN